MTTARRSTISRAPLREGPLSSVIDRVFAYEALDSRGWPTVACIVRAGAHEGHALAPAGASTGSHEARELRDGDEDRFQGRGVRKAVAGLNGEIAAALVGRDPADQAGIDAALLALDGTPNLLRLGANAVLAASIACALCAAARTGQPLWRYFADGAEPQLPLPMVNIISGGAHAGGSIDIQDFLVIPVGARSFSEAMEWVWRVREATAVAMAYTGSMFTTLVADEGGLADRFPSNRAALDALGRGIERSGLRPGKDVAVAIDVAATEFHQDGRYHFWSEERALEAGELVNSLSSWCGDFPIVSIEDAMAEDDAAGWALVTERFGGKLQLIGDDLFATNLGRLRRGIDGGTANAVLVKPNQNGTLTGTKAVFDLARANGYATVLSARSGETEDSWLADLAVGWRAGQIKVGSNQRSERTAKWNRLLRIEAELGGPGAAPFAGAAALGKGRKVGQGRSKAQGGAP